MEREYEILETIGKGSFGVVRKVRRVRDGKVLVAKEMRYGLMNSKDKEDSRQLSGATQVNILKELNHPHIVRYYDRIVEKKEATVYILMEYCPGGDLGSLIRKAKRDKEFINENVIWKIFTQIISSLEYCHTRSPKVLHRDIKPANVFIDHNNDIKLGDFGLSREMGEYSEFAHSHVGTPYYMSPEQIQELQYDDKSDIWSAGCLLYELAALHRPFEASNTLALACKIQNGHFPRVPPLYSETLQLLIEAMLKVDLTQRVTAADIVKLPIIKVRIEDRLIREKYQELRLKEEAIRKKEAKLKNQRALLLSKKDQNAHLLPKKDQNAPLVPKKDELSTKKDDENTPPSNFPDFSSNITLTSKITSRILHQ